MKKRYIAVIFGLLCKCALWAQEVKVMSFELDGTDLTAQHENVKDANGDMCALIKVQILDDKVTFEGDVIGKPKHNQNEYYVYVIDGTQRLKISTENTMPTEIEFSKFNIEEVKGGSTYVLKLEMPEKAPGAVFEVGVPDVDIVVDGKAYKTDATGGLDLPLANGNHTFKVSKEGYKTQEGTITIDKVPAIRKIEMQRGDGLVNKGLLAITYPLNATFTIVPINSSAAAPNKKSVMTGEQIALNGDYQILFSKKKYKSLRYAVTVKPGDDIKLALSGVALEADARLLNNNYTKAFKEYKKLADKGDDLAQYKLGCFYYDGKGTMANHSLAMQYWRLAANQGNLDAGRKLADNENLESEKLKWLRKMADNGDCESMLSLASHYENQKDWSQMTQWLQKAYAMGDYKAYGVMGDVYYEGKGCMQNYSRAYTYYKVAEAHGDAHAKERVLDYSYLGLDGHEQNKKMAVDEYVKLGDMLSDDGNYKIGMYYYEEYEKNDNNIFESYAKNYFSKINPASAKVHWTAKAKDVFFKLAKEETQYNSTFYYLLCELAGAKSPSIYNKLGNAYRLGYGVNADVSKAYQYYKKSSEMGDREGLCWMGFCYERGYGVPQNLEEAALLYKKAADLGSMTAMGYLGTLYAQVKGGLAKDMNKAVALWTKAGNGMQISSVRNLIKYYKAKKNSKQVQYWSNKLKIIQDGKQ